ncbi:sugar phosphate nucleotidyltransferase [Halococcoides cellulosivorans]|uniref:Bifunctional protein GlmU n=1 Tax=Halococcoides cellulosivorans TaxID=1679096 RepID=A0A2R4WZX5_9EURY|nr:NDP-sugar synthase [Halococcoides cellulosivorans]AWB27106.1 glucose-1-phosphate thymidylyltransferase [Halococcoides cellulosivorans]
MDAVVLAGGFATRLWPITRDRPKMFLPIGDTTVVDRIFRDLEDDDRVDDVYVSTNEEFADDFREHLADSEFEKPAVSVEDASAESEKFGVVGALGQLVDREGIDSDTLVIAGDNLISFGLSEFIDTFEENGDTTIAAYDVGDLERATQYGVIDVDGDRVTEFQEKPDDPPSTLVSIACYAFTAETLGLFETYLSGDNNPDEPGWFITWLIDREPVRAFPFEGAWFDIGTPDGYLDAVSWYLDGGTLVHPDARVEDSDLGANVHVMEGATVTDSTLERSVVFPNATLRSCQIFSSIIDQNTQLEEVTLSNAQIGAYTSLVQEPPVSAIWEQNRDSQ